MTGTRIAAAVGGELVGGDGSRDCIDVAIDSRRVRPGTCFFAIVGPRDDGHRYLPQAIAAGAAALVIQRDEVLPHLENPTGAAVILVDDTTRALQELAGAVRREIDPIVVAITGSVGKTTTKALTHALLRDSAPTHATPGNFNNHWGLPLSLLGLEVGHEWMVAELGMSAAGEIALLGALAQPQIAVITNVAPVHMENFASVEGVALAKRELAESLTAEGTLIVNADNPHTALMAAEFEGRVARVLTFGRSEGATVRATNLRREGGAWEFELHLPGAAPVAVTLPLPGEHSVANYLAAAAAAHALGIGPETIAARAGGLALPAMRGEICRTSGGVEIIDDSYNASPAAMLSAIETLAGRRTGGRRVLAAGDMLELGAWAEDAHREVGLHAANLGVDVLITVGPLARDIARGAIAGGLAAENVHSFSSSEEAAEVVDSIVEAGDTLLIKGSRGTRMERLAQALLGAEDEETS
jgi:UDP-N-acetylmuramoyl-tripeptide--D-alanyl-D-alanine ligase